jgi:hypothetical protein
MKGPAFLGVSLAGVAMLSQSRSMAHGIDISGGLLKPVVYSNIIGAEEFRDIEPCIPMS